MSTDPKPDFAANLFRNLLELWVTPEVKARQQAGALESPLDLRMAQIVLTPGQKPLIRVNEEVRGEAKFKLKSGESLKVGDPIRANQLKSLQSFKLVDSERDCGHATMLRMADMWFISFDFIYNKKSSAEHIKAAQQFLSTAKLALDAAMYRPFVDNLVSASELSAKAYLLSRPDRFIMNSKTHGLIHSRINLERKRGNVEEHHANSYNLLQGMRSSARYLESDFSIDEGDARKLYGDIEAFVLQVQSQLPAAT